MELNDEQKMGLLDAFIKCGLKPEQASIIQAWVDEL